jgi:hypothetical protein
MDPTSGHIAIDVNGGTRKKALSIDHVAHTSPQKKEKRMKTMITAVALTLFAAGSVLAADVITLPAKNGPITFNHKKHGETLKECKLCHEDAKGGKIAALGKDWAHKTCKGCHEEKKAGPTTCSECHKK